MCLGGCEWGCGVGVLWGIAVFKWWNCLMVLVVLFMRVW